MSSFEDRLAMHTCSGSKAFKAVGTTGSLFLEGQVAALDVETLRNVRISLERLRLLIL